MPPSMTTRAQSTNGHSHAHPPVLITGGAGFVGTNLAHHLLSSGTPVHVYDNLSRPGVEDNLQWLFDTHGAHLTWQIDDVRDRDALAAAVEQAACVYHFAGQVAVTTSLEAPMEDFKVNVHGTLNLLETLRQMDSPPPLIFTSTNKVYGNLSDLTLEEKDTRYMPAETEVERHGISESQPLDFHSPYGCSKGTADQYVLDYARSYGLPAIVFRMSCIYGRHQCGTEDQGWIAHFAKSVLEHEPITLFGDGKQVRDVLFADDLVAALVLARKHIDRLSGEAFNIGGGTDNAVSLLEVITMLSELHGTSPRIHFSRWREGDQKYYVSDASKFSEATGWSPAVRVPVGVKKLYNWLRREQDVPSKEFSLA